MFSFFTLVHLPNDYFRTITVPACSFCLSFTLTRDLTLFDDNTLFVGMTSFRCGMSLKRGLCLLNVNLSSGDAIAFCVRSSQIDLAWSVSLPQ